MPRRKISETKLVKYTDQREDSRERKVNPSAGMLHSQVLEKVSKRSAMTDREAHMRMMLTPPKQESGVHQMRNSSKPKDDKPEANILQLDSNRKAPVDQENKFQPDETRALLEKYLEYLIEHSQANISDQDNEIILKSVKRLDAH